MILSTGSKVFYHTIFSYLGCDVVDDDETDCLVEETVGDGWTGVVSCVPYL